MHSPLLAAGLESELEKIILYTEDSLRLAAGSFNHLPAFKLEDYSKLIK
jgi:hypothetical protein|tara:strand:- start:13211 stop:13357 length:147 start_codon:yes stop_codon:yes gene_type:complete